MGSGKDYRSGYVNIDINPKFKPDILQDICEISFEPESVDEILASDIIDQITFAEAKKLIRNCHKWLKPRGVLHIHLPNVEVCGLLAAKNNIEALRWLYGSTGEGSSFYDTNHKKWAYGEKSLRKLLEDTGFKILEMAQTCLGYGFRTIAIKED